jgi:hypothetical protein
MKIVNFLAGAAALGAVAAPAAAQYYPQQQPYAQPYQQTYPQQAYPGTAYGQGYGYNQGNGNVVTDIIDSLLGNRYSVTDRQAVRQCASAAMAQAGQRYGGYNRGGMRVTSISGVERRGNGVRVSGMMSTGYAGQYGNRDDNRDRDQNRAYAGAGDISFRCNVAYNGQVSNIRIGGGYRRY